MGASESLKVLMECQCQNPRRISADCIYGSEIKTFWFSEKAIFMDISICQFLRS